MAKTQNNQARVAYTTVEGPKGWTVAACREGEDGYHPVPDYGPYADEAHARGIVDRLNTRLGLDKVTAFKIVVSTMPMLRPGGRR
jgi:hypothetical protein